MATNDTIETFKGIPNALITDAKVHLCGLFILNGELCFRCKLMPGMKTQFKSFVMDRNKYKYVHQLLSACQKIGSLSMFSGLNQEWLDKYEFHYLCNHKDFKPPDVPTEASLEQKSSEKSSILRKILASQKSYISDF